MPVPVVASLFAGFLIAFLGWGGGDRVPRKLLNMGTRYLMRPHYICRISFLNRNYFFPTRSFFFLLSHWPCNFLSKSVWFCIAWS